MRPATADRPRLSSMVSLLSSRPVRSGGRPHAGSASNETRGEPVRGTPRTDAIGERLLAEGLVTAEQLARALKIQQQSGGRLGPILVKMGALSDAQLARSLAEQWGLPYVGQDREAGGRR